MLIFDGSSSKLASHVAVVGVVVLEELLPPPHPVNVSAATATKLSVIVCIDVIMKSPC